jgi:simple sugar transport system ATP-binding protein
MNTQHDKPPVLKVESLSKSFGGVHALQDVSFTLRRGEVLGLLGDNGAGKSTAIKCISGVLIPDSGKVYIDGQEVHIDSPRRAREEGIETVYQGLALVNELNVTENLYLNRELVSSKPILGRLGWLDKKRMKAEGKKVLDTLQIRIPSSNRDVIYLSGGQRQSIAIGRAAGWGRHIVILDEPTAALGVEQTAQVLELITRLSQNNIAVILISHNMRDIISVCTRALILRQGRTVADVDIADVDERDLVDYIMGTHETQLS